MYIHYKQVFLIYFFFTSLILTNIYIISFRSRPILLEIKSIGISKNGISNDKIPIDLN